MTFCAATAGGGWADDNDDRWFADSGRGLFYICDASGPTYGGYHAPFAVDSGMATFLATFDQAEGEGSVRLELALAAAHSHMRDLSLAHDAAITELCEAQPDRLRASLLGADRVRPPRWEHLRAKSFAHFGSSITACFIDQASLALVQVGSSRAYSARGTSVNLLAPDHTLPTVLEQQGQKAAPFHGRVVVSLLGVSDDLRVTRATVDVRPGDRLLLCSDGLWACEHGEALVRTLLRTAALERDVSRLVCETAAREKCDVTVLVVSVL